MSVSNKMTKQTDYKALADAAYGITDNLKKLHRYMEGQAEAGEYAVDVGYTLTAAEVTNLEADGLTLTTVDAMTTNISWA